MLTLSKISACDLLDTFVVIDSLPGNSDFRVLMLPQYAVDTNPGLRLALNQESSCS